MPIDFGTNVSREIPGIGVLLSGSEAALLQRHRDAQQKRMARPRQAGTLKESERLQVYIYNVGPFSRKMELGSLGAIVLPALPEKDVLKGLAVAGPSIRQGLPAEPFPGEPRGIWLESDPSEHLRWTDEDGEAFSLNERPGIDEALRIIGAHEQSPKPIHCASPYQQGCFVSVIPEQKAEPREPKEPGDKASASARREYSKLMIQYEEDVRLWAKWQASVQAAQLRFREWAARRGEEQSLAFSNGTYVRDEELYVLARILNKTERDWNFLSGTADTVVKRKCWNCKLVIDSDAATCGHCKERQVSAEEYEKRRAAVMAA